MAAPLSDAGQNSTDGDRNAFKGKQHQQFSRTSSNRAQDRQFAPASIEAGEDHGHQTTQPNQGNQPRNQQQRLLTLPHDFPELIQRHAGHHAHQRFIDIIRDGPLHGKDITTLFQADELDGNAFGSEIELPDQFGRCLLYTSRCV